MMNPAQILHPHRRAIRLYPWLRAPWRQYHIERRRRLQHAADRAGIYVWHCDHWFKAIKFEYGYWHNQWLLTMEDQHGDHDFLYLGPFPL